MRPRITPAAAGALCVVLGALLWSTGGAAVKWLPQPPLAVSAGRSLLAAGLMLLVCGGRVAPPRSPGFWVGVACYAWVVTGFVLATRLTTAANAILLQFTSPLWVIVLGGWLLGERPRRSDWAALAIGAFGIVLCLWDGLASSLAERREGLLTPESAGDLIALSTGFAFGLCFIAMRKANRAEPRAGGWDARVMIFWGNAAAVAVGAGWLALSPPAEGAGALLAGGVAAALVMLWLGFAQLGGGYLLVQHGMRQVGAIQASLLTLIEPVLNPLWVLLVAGERPAAMTIAGGSLVIGGLALNVALRGRPRRILGSKAAEGGEA